MIQELLIKKTYLFPKFGDFHGNGRSMQWFVLKGEDGTCFTAYYGDGPPLPLGSV
jgi:hypothetical protein